MQHLLFDDDWAKFAGTFTVPFVVDPFPERSTKLVQDAMRLLTEAVDSIVPEDLDDPLQVLAFRASALSLAHEVFPWMIGDLINQMVPEVGKMRACRIVADAMGSSVHWALELAKVAKLFDSPYRVVGVPWSTYRAAAHTARPIETLTETLKRGEDARHIRSALKRAKAARC